MFRCSQQMKGGYSHVNRLFQKAEKIRDPRMSLNLEGGEVGINLVGQSSHCLASVRLMGFRAWALLFYSFVCLLTEHLLHHFGRDTTVRKLPDEFQRQVCIYFCLLMVVIQSLSAGIERADWGACLALQIGILECLRGQQNWGDGEDGAEAGLWPGLVGNPSSQY